MRSGTASIDFKLLFAKGRRFESALFRIVARKNELASSRFAFVAPKLSSGSAVKRNRVRRQAKEWVRKNLPLTPKPVDLAVVFKKEAFASERKKFYEELASSIHRALSS